MSAGLVCVIGVAVRAEDGVFVSDGGGEGEQLADLCAGYGGGDGVIGAANFDGGVGFEVPHVDMAGAAFEHEEDAGFGFGGPDGCGFGLQLQEPWEREAAEPAGAADAKHFATVDV